MIDGFITELTIALIATVVGGFATYVVNERWEKRKLNNKALQEKAQEWGQYSGTWHGVHISRGGESSHNVLSHHEYNLNVEANGDVTGSMRDFLEDPPCVYDVKGRMSEGGLILDSKCKSRPSLVAVEVYTNPMNTNKLKGVLVSYDYKEHHPFVSFIVLTRTKLTDGDYMRYVEDLKKERLYLTLDREQPYPELNAAKV